MKKRLLMWAMLLAVVAQVMAQTSEIAITTTLPTGTEFTFNPTVTSGTVSVDWGDGNIVAETVQTNSWGGTIGYVGQVKGPEIHIYGKFSRIDLTSKQITGIKVVGQATLDYLNLSKNQLTGRPGYDNSVTDLSGAPNLTYLDVSDNNLEWLVLTDFKNLESVYASNNPELNSLFICEEGAKQEAIKTINASDCDISHFWPRNLPNLSSLNLEGNSLMDIEIADHYPELWILTLSNNTYLSAVDVSKCSNLMQLSLRKTAISTLNVSQCADLQSLDVADTKLTQLNLKNNKGLRSIYASNTDIEKLDVSQMEDLRTIYVDNTKLKRLDLRMKRYLQYVSIAGTDIEWLDMHHAIGYNAMRTLDMRNCTKMTPQSLNFTFDAMPFHYRSSYQTTLFLEGTAYEHANFNLIADDEDNYWKADVPDGDRSASMEKIALTVLPTTGGTYKLQYQGGSSDYGNVPEWGSYSQYFTFFDVTDGKVIPGHPVRVTDIQPEPGCEFVGIEVNGVFIDDNEFQISEPGTVRVVFKAATSTSVIKLTVPAGSSQQYFLGADEDGTAITVDWGDGVQVPYTIGTGLTYVGVDELEGQTTSGTTVTISGAVTRAIFDSYPFVATDNMITGIDLSGTSILKELSAYMNEVEAIDVSGQRDLESLDVSYCELDDIVLTNNTKLTHLHAYGNYLTEVDLSHAPALTTVDLKGNLLKSLDLTNNAKVDTLIVQNNDLTALDVSNLTNLRHLEAWNNQIAQLDVTHSPYLIYLAVNQNQLTQLDLSQNPYLMGLNVSANHLQGLDVSDNPWLYLANVSQNDWDACTINKFLATLNDYPLTDQEIEDYQVGIALRLDSYCYASTADYPANQFAAANTTLATQKRWSVDYTGDGSANCSDAIGQLSVDAAAGTTVDIYDLQGNLRYSGVAAEGMVVGLPKGVYVVKTGNQTRKVVLK